MPAYAPHKIASKELVSQEKGTEIQIQLLHTTLTYYQNKADSHPQIIRIKPTLTYIFPYSAFLDFNPQQTSEIF